ncbi:MAG: response regulator, partial [Zoogloeaceae bacterium]|nr:response regulator [Zoogloeaceae bacterium]
PKALEYIAGIRNAGANLLNIINDILDFSRIESGKLEIAHERYETASLLNDVLTVIRMRLDDTPIELIVTLDPDIPGILLGDMPHVQQILLNLLSNAVKYTQKGYIKFSAVQQKIGATEIRLRFTVEDSGVGIKAEDLPSLFGDFVRLEEMQHQHIQGTGLGLAITRRLCHALGGGITVASEYGKGSTFTATLLQGVADWQPMGDLATQRARHVQAQRISFTAPEANVLLVDDLPSNLLVAEGLLMPYKMQIVTCLSGREAIDLAQKQPFDLVLMDHMMPGMDGIKATEVIRALPDERYRRLPIVALTANAISGMKDLFLAHGFNDYLSKPIETPKLNAILEKWIPAEKQRPLEKAADVAPENKAAPDDDTSANAALPAIEGVDTEAGLAIIGGSPERYRRLLEIFCRDARARLSNLAAISPQG